MQNKLQELTDKLYNEGLSKGKQEGEEILARARQEAAQIVSDARAEAEAIVEKARKDAANEKSKIESDVKISSLKALSATKQAIENLVIAKAGTEKTEKTLKDPEFVKTLVKAVAEGFSAEGDSKELQAVLPESLKNSLEPYIKDELSKIGSVEISFSKKIAGGFTIGPKDGGYFISLTDETFAELIGEYLRPATKKILFG